MDRAARLKLILWSFLGVAFAVAMARFIFGLGATTHLSDATPWGLWIGFDVMSGVALAAGGFILTASVYVFKLEEFHPIVRPAVLTAFLGYAAVVVGLLFDLGLPLNIWHMIIYWNPHSPLFEVGWCVMLYLTVLAMEFFPVPAEDISALASVRRFLLKFRLPLVITGIALSTLHQSSLGSLFLIIPYRLHPLWYSPILPVLFFVSAVALGLMVAITESNFTAFVYRRKTEAALMEPLASAARWVLVLYLLLRIGDLAVRRQLHYLISGGWQVRAFWVELTLMVFLPVILFSIRRLRQDAAWQWAIAGIGVFGVVMDRIDVGGFVDLGRGGTFYWPSWDEVAVSLGIVAGATLVFLFFIEHFHVWEERPADPNADPRRLPELNKIDETWLGTPRIAGRIKYSMAFILAAAVGFAMTSNPKVAAHGFAPTPVHSPRGSYDKMILDADVSGYAVTFYHQKEIDRNGGKQSCVICHHMNMPHAEDSGCYQCHSDMYLPVDSFRHDWHASPQGANLACIQCHKPGLPRTAANTVACSECHKHLVPPGATIEIKQYNAPSYVDSMHVLCIGCHAKVALKENKPDIARCAECHQGRLNYADAENLLYQKREMAGRFVVLPPPKVSDVH
ncbi:MAG: NrfD/PsrC family molybdoenzyme membrane anchor subunit [Acidobacteriaceae bacterium]